MNYIYVELSGGIGNQLFQFALGLRISEEQKVNVIFDPWRYSRSRVHEGFLLAPFILRAQKLGHNVSLPPQSIFHPLLAQVAEVVKRNYPIISNYDYIYEQQPYKYSPLQILTSKTPYLIGSWQTEKYFEGSKNAIKDLISSTLRQQFSDKSLNFPEGISSPCSIAIHVRRGDYAKNPQVRRDYGLMGNQYYHDGISILESKLGDLEYFVFSDDIDWVKTRLELPKKPTYVSCKDYKSIDELYLMSRCAHFITANSSFSWWGAYLGNFLGKMVITPQKWFVGLDATPDLIPEGWSQIGASSCE